MLDASPAQLVAHLSAFPGTASTCFVPEVRPVWRQASRALRLGGILVAGFANHALYVFDDALAEQGQLVVRHAVPYSDISSLSDEERRRFTNRDEPLDAGFVLTGRYEDRDPDHPLAKFLPTFIATRAVRPA